jgi:hypothetical protein
MLVNPSALLLLVIIRMSLTSAVQLGECQWLGTIVRRSLTKYASIIPLSINWTDVAGHKARSKHDPGIRTDHPCIEFDLTLWFWAVSRHCVSYNLFWAWWYQSQSSRLSISHSYVRESSNEEVNIDLAIKEFQCWIFWSCLSNKGFEPASDNATMKHLDLNHVFTTQLRFFQHLGWLRGYVTWIVLVTKVIGSNPALCWF